MNIDLEYTLANLCHGMEHGHGAGDLVSIHPDLNISIKAAREDRSNLDSWANGIYPLPWFYTLYILFVKKSFPVLGELLCFWISLLLQCSLIIPGGWEELNWLNGGAIH
jgi:hypothetical protein